MKLLKPTIELIRTSIWKAFYLLSLKKGSYNETMKNAAFIGDYIKDSTRGRMNLFYDIDGNQIRGFTNPKPTSKHPLIKKYS